MNELVVFVLVLLGVIVLIMFFQFINSRRDDKLYLQKLANEFGKVHRSSYDHDRLKGALAYHMRHITKDALDDITWSDLSMDEITACFDTTESEAGCQVLYHMLRTPLTDPGEITHRRKLIEFWRKNGELRNRVLLALHHTGTGQSPVCEMIDKTAELETPSFVPYFVRIALLILSFVSIYFLSGIGVVVFIIILLSNLYIYYRDKSRILPYMRVYSRVLSLLESSDTVCKALSSDVPADEAVKSQITGMKQVIDDLKPLRRGTSAALGAERGTNPFSVLISLAGIFVYADIIRFWHLKDELVSRKEDIDKLTGLTGSIDAYIAMAGYVESMSARMSEAVFGDSPVIRFDNLVHPLIDNAVPNSLTVDRSILLTGPNASGKSTFLKSVALAAIYAQTTGYVCADRYEAPVCLVASAMSVTDDVTTGDSYYMAEIKAVKRMIDRFTDIELRKGEKETMPLCFVDELLNGTNTEERIAACTQILKYMDKCGIRVMAATHDVELTSLLTGIYGNYHFEEDLSDGDVRFSYRIKDNAADSRNAIKLLSSLGFDEGLVEDADEMVRIHESEGVWKSR